MNPLSSPLSVLCGLSPSNMVSSEAELGVTADQLEQLLIAATNTSNYHTRPPPSEDRSHDRRPVEKFRLTCLAPSSLSTSSSSSAAVSLCKAAGPIPAIHIAVWMRAYMQGGDNITGETLTELIDMCLSNEPEWVHKVQQVALAILLSLMESKGDTQYLNKFIGSVLCIPSPVGSGGSSGSSSVAADDISVIAQLKHHPIVTQGSQFSSTSPAATPTAAMSSPASVSSPALHGGVPDVVVSCPHFRFIMEGSTGGGSGDVDLSAQVRITNAGKANLSVRIAQEIAIVDGVIVVGKSGNDGSSSSSPLSTQSPSDPLQNMDMQVLLERSYLKKGESSRLLISLVAKNAQSLSFKTYHKVLILMIQDSVKVIVSFAVINPRQAPFGTRMPSAICQPVVESPLGAYEAPMILQVLKHHFQLLGGFGWREVAGMLSTHALHPSHHSHGASSSSISTAVSNKIMAEAIELRNKMCEEWPCSALLPKLWSHAMNGSQLTSAVFGVPTPPPGIAPTPTNANVVHFTSATSSTLKQRASVPVSCCAPIGYTPGSVRPAGIGSTSTGANTNPSSSPNAGSPTSADLQLLNMSPFRIDCLMTAQPQTLFALILLWFAEFPTAMLDRSLTMCDPCVYLETMQPSLQHLMAWLIDFCCGLLLHSECNGTTIRNLALTFAPLLMDHQRLAVPAQPQARAMAAANTNNYANTVVSKDNEDPRRQHSSSPLDLLQTTATPQRQLSNEGQATSENSNGFGGAITSAAYKEYNIGRGQSMQFNYSDVSNAFQQHYQSNAATPQQPQEQPSLSSVGNDSNPCFRDPESLFTARLNEGYEPLPINSTSTPATSQGASYSDGIGARFTGDRAPASRQEVPKDALSGDVALQLHCTTAIIHWIKKYQPLYRKATGPGSNTSPSLASKGADGTLSPRPLSPQTQAL